MPNLKGIKLPGGLQLPTGNPVTTSGGSSTEATSSLKEALLQSTGKGDDQAAQMDGFYLIRIPFPLDAQRVANTLRSIGLGSLVDKFELSLNRGPQILPVAPSPSSLPLSKNLTFFNV